MGDKQKTRQRQGFGQMAVITLPIILLIGALATSDEKTASNIELTSEERAWLDQNPQKLVLLFNTEFPPIEFSSGAGMFIGMGADIITRIEEQLDVAFIKNPSDDWNAHLAALKSGECAIAPTIVRTPEREEYAFFTNPYATVPVVIITTNAFSGKLTLDDFTGRRIGVVSGYATEKYLEDRALLSKFEIVAVPSVPEGLQSVSFGQIDAFVENLAVAAYYIDQAGIPNLRLTGTTDYSFAWSIGVSRKYPLLYSSIQKALNAIPKSELTAIKEDWIALKAVTGLDAETLHLLELTALFTVLLLLSLAAITFILKHRLNQKVADLRASEDKYKRLAENSPAIVFQFTMETDGTFAFPYINESLFVTAGVTVKEAMHDSSTFLRNIHPDDFELYRERVLESAKSLCHCHVIFRYIKNDRIHWFEVHSTPERLPSGERSGTASSSILQRTSRRRRNMNDCRLS